MTKGFSPHVQAWQFAKPLWRLPDGTHPAGESEEIHLGYDDARVSRVVLHVDGKLAVALDRHTPIGWFEVAAGRGPCGLYIGAYLDVRELLTESLRVRWSRGFGSITLSALPAAHRVRPEDRSG